MRNGFSSELPSVDHMKFRIADTFTDSLAKLTGEEQKAVKTTAFDLQVDPANPGMRFHKLDRAKDPNFWSVRASRDIRLIVHRSRADLLLCYVDHHDDAYAWAERRKLATHPKTGAAQLVEVRETVKEITVPVYITEETPTSPAVDGEPLFADRSEEELLAYGVPEEWLADVRAATEETLFEVADHLPKEAAEALLELATGGTPAKPTPAGEGADPFDHPDAQRRFRLLEDADELKRALDAPWGEMGGVPPPRPAGGGGPSLQRPGPRRRFGRHRENGRRRSSRRRSRATGAGRPATVHDLLPAAGRRLAAEGRAARRRGRRSVGPHHRFRGRGGGPVAVRGAVRAADTAYGEGASGSSLGGVRRRPFAPVLRPFSLDGMDGGGGRLAADELGPVPHGAPSGP